jgi:hypothetical protein
MPYRDIDQIIFVDPKTWYYANQQDPRYKTGDVVVQIAKLWKCEVKEAEKEITPLIEPDQSANPDPSVSGQPGPNGDSSVNGEKPTAGIDSGNAEFTSALEELEKLMLY